MRPSLPPWIAGFGCLVCLLGGPLSAKTDDGWIPLFNGKDLTGWVSNEETPGAITVEDGAIKTAKGRAHAFYAGPDGRALFKNFELKLRVKKMPGSNSGVYFHTTFQEKGWPDNGYEAQVNSQLHKDPRKTGSLYAVRDVRDKAPVADEVWFDYLIRVDGKRIVIQVNGVTTADWTEPADWDPTTVGGNRPGRRLGEGKIALQAHDPDSVVHFKDILLRPLP